MHEIISHIEICRCNTQGLTHFKLLVKTSEQVPTWLGLVTRFGGQEVKNETFEVVVDASGEIVEVHHTRRQY
jgi:hypothetical protein